MKQEKWLTIFDAYVIYYDKWCKQIWTSDVVHRKLVQQRPNKTQNILKIS